MTYGGARYIATGRGFATTRISFAILYSRFAGPSIYLGMRTLLLLLYVTLSIWLNHCTSSPSASKTDARSALLLDLDHGPLHRAVRVQPAPVLARRLHHRLPRVPALDVARQLARTRQLVDRVLPSLAHQDHRVQEEEARAPVREALNGRPARVVEGHRRVGGLCAARPRGDPLHRVPLRQGTPPPPRDVADSCSPSKRRPSTACSDSRSSRSARSSSTPSSSPRSSSSRSLRGPSWAAAVATLAPSWRVLRISDQSSAWSPSSSSCGSSSATTSATPCWA